MMTEAADNQMPSFAGASDGPGIWGEAVSFWTPKPCGDQTADYARGVGYAVEALGYCRDYNNHAAVVYALIEIAARGDLSNLELGFLDRIAEAARRGGMN